MGSESFEGLPRAYVTFVGSHLVTYVERGTVRVKCLAHEHSTMSWPGTRSAQFRDERTNHEATVPSTQYYTVNFLLISF